MVTGDMSRRPSESAVGAHLDEEITLEALARQFSQEEGADKQPTQAHWERAREEFARRQLAGGSATSSSHEVKPKAATKPSDFDMRVEEAMHLGR